MLNQGNLKESTQKETTTRKKEFYQNLKNLKLKLKKVKNQYGKDSILNAAGALTPECVEEYQEDCKELKKAIQEYIESEKKAGKSIKAKLGEKLNLGLKLDTNKLEALEKAVPEDSKNFSKTEALSSDINNMAKAMENLIKSIKPTSSTNKDIIKKLTGLEKQLKENLEILSTSFILEQDNEAINYLEKLNETDKTRKKELLKKIEKLNFSFDPYKSGSIVDKTGKITVAVTDYRESCKKMSSAIEQYIEAEKQSKKTKLKSILSLKLNTKKLTELKRALDNSQITSDKEGKVALSCDYIMGKMSDLRKSIKPTSPTNAAIIKKLKTFENQLNNNLKIHLKQRTKK